MWNKIILLFADRVADRVEDRMDRWATKKTQFLEIDKEASEIKQELAEASTIEEKEAVLDKIHALANRAST